MGWNFTWKSSTIWTRVYGLRISFCFALSLCMSLCFTRSLCRCHCLFFTHFSVFALVSFIVQCLAGWDIFEHFLWHPVSLVFTRNSFHFEYFVAHTMTKPICFCATKSFAFSIGSFNSQVYRTHWAARSSIVRPTLSAGKMLLKNKFKCAICFLRHSHSIAWMIMGSNRFSMKMNEIMVKMYTIRSDQWVTVKCRTEIAKYAILF